MADSVRDLIALDFRNEALGPACQALTKLNHLQSISLWPATISGTPRNHICHTVLCVTVKPEWMHEAYAMPWLPKVKEVSMRWSIFTFQPVFRPLAQFTLIHCSFAPPPEALIVCL